MSKGRSNEVAKPAKNAFDAGLGSGPTAGVGAGGAMLHATGSLQPVLHEHAAPWLPVYKARGGEEKEREREREQRKEELDGELSKREACNTCTPLHQQSPSVAFTSTRHRSNTKPSHLTTSVARTLRPRAESGVALSDRTGEVTEVGVVAATARWDITVRRVGAGRAVACGAEVAVGTCAVYEEEPRAEAETEKGCVRRVVKEEVGERACEFVPRCCSSSFDVPRQFPVLAGP